MTKLGVNLDHIATIREARKTDEPDPVLGSYIVELAGAVGVTIHLREDRRHIQDRDLDLFRRVISKLKLNLEMAATQEMLEIACRIKPDQVTLVPENREEVTTEGGLDVILHEKKIGNVIDALHKCDITTSIFIDPDEKIVRQAYKLGAQAVELHTGTYSLAKNLSAIDNELKKVKNNSLLGVDLGLIVHAGHGLTYQNVVPIASIKEITELNIGHSIIARSVYVGLERAIREMIALIK